MTFQDLKNKYPNSDRTIDLISEIVDRINGYGRISDFDMDIIVETVSDYAFNNIDIDSDMFSIDVVSTIREEILHDELNVDKFVSGAISRKVH